MDSSTAKAKPNPRENANMFSVLFWWWTVDVFRKGYHKVLETEDMCDPIKMDQSAVLGDRLDARWSIEVENAKKNNREPSLLRAISCTFLWHYLIIGVLQLIDEFCIGVGTPILLAGLLRYFQSQSTTTYNEAILFATGIVVATTVKLFTTNHVIFEGYHVGGRVRVAVCSVIYRKALRLSKMTMGETPPGKIVNLVANDVNTLEIVSITIHYLWSAPLCALIITYILYNEVGYAGIIGVTAVFFAVALQSYTGKLAFRYRFQTALKTDERVRLTDEIVAGVQVIKMYAWEKPFCALIEMARKLELKVIRKSSFVRGTYLTFNIFTARMALFCTLVSMAMLGNRLTADKIFVFSSFFSLMGTMSGLFVRGITDIAECRVAVRRLQNVLMHEEIQGDDSCVTSSLGSDNDSFDELNNKDNSFVESSSFKEYCCFDKEDNIKERKDEKQEPSDLKMISNDSVGNAANISNGKKSDKVGKKAWAVKLNHVTAKWNSNQSENTLDELNFEVEKGMLLVVIGTIGAGKSSLLSAILRELNLEAGSIQVKGSLSYAAQDSWLFGATVRQNILFGKPYDRDRYQRVVKACALLSDFKQFSQGDQTLVGDRGSSLSGGQKARINLARSVYKQADIYLLDDPLSAVDAHVGKHLFEECLQRYLDGKTRILVTHQLRYIKDADAIMLLEQGKMHVFSNYNDLLIARPDYATILAVDEGEEEEEEALLEKSESQRRFSKASNRSLISEDSAGNADDKNNEIASEQIGAQLEGTSHGIVKGSIFLKYLQSGSPLYCGFLIFALFAVTQGLASLCDSFVSIWVTAEENRYFQSPIEGFENDDSTKFAENSTAVDIRGVLPINTYIYMYTTITILIFIVGITRSLLFFTLCMRNGQSLHDQMFGSLIRTSLRFFDTNPTGRILNRFSKDMGATDELLPKSLFDSSQVSFQVVGALILVCTVNPIFLIPIILLGCIFYWIQRVYLKTSKDVKRLEGIARSPVFTHLNATLNGLTTIRAYGAQDILTREFDRYQDTHTASWYMFVVTSTAFGFSLDLFCLVFTTLVIFSFLLLESSFTGGQVGLAITQVMAVTVLIQWGLRMGAETENQLMSVERILEYTQLTPEPNLRDNGIMRKMKKNQDEPSSPSSAPKGWPDKGRIEFIDVYLRYSDEDPPVLKGLNLVIQPGEKVGIVGRTGAGKSSLISALFRLAKIEGVIEIDGIDTGSIYVEDLRCHISIIPQDPVLFSGTLRRNLDPFNEFPDSTLWEVLEEVELKVAIVNTEDGLESRVLEGGSNYSVGQRQLVCLARAVLRSNRILMLDEATANVDPYTDSLIQSTIRRKFSSCTVLTVAHRLNTIIDSDKVLVMDKGRMTEFDHPHVLLQNENGSFTSMVQKTGRAMHDQLVKIAKDAYKTTHEDR